MSEQAKYTIDGAKRAAAFDNIERMIPDFVKEAAMVARIRRIHYDASIKEGFTPEQALALCMKPSLT